MGMTSRGEDAEGPAGFVSAPEHGVISRSAFELHSLAIVATFRDRSPGFVRDAYLDALPAEAALAALELQSAGLWERGSGGYLIRDDPAISMLVGHMKTIERLEVECEARGAHTPGKERVDSLVTLCTHCFVPLRREDSGPVALPGGRRLASDRADHAESSD
jgi:hypothetical protein